MAVIVTGSSGYIGQQLVKRLKREGEFVIGVDRLEPYSDIKPNVFFMHDYVDIDDKYFHWYDVDTIIHTAGTSLLAPSVADPISYYENNVAKTVVLLNTLRSLKKKPNIIFSSSASIYGDRGCQLINETSLMMDPPTPGSPYAQTMWMKENILKDCSDAYGLRTLALRYFNVAGADIEGTTGQQHDAPHIIPAMLRAYKNGKTFTMYGTEHELVDTTCRRDYIHVEDLVEAHVLAIKRMRSEYVIPYAINLGTGRGTSNKEVLAQVEKTVGCNLYIEWKPERPTDIKFLIANIYRAKNRLNWEPKHSSLNDIVETAWAWHKDKI